MFCSRCGSEVHGKVKFCPSCGLDLMATTPVHAIATGQVQDVDLVREALAAEYDVLEELGRGGMALVYRAMDRHLEREVAIKVLPFSLGFDAEFVERFQREARTAAQLEHPNIIPIYRVGRAGRVIYFVMKYLRGGSLSTVLAERGKLTPPEIRRILVEAGSALGYAAKRGIVHRDIKPDNIMFDEFGQCMLTDFGIAKAASGQRLTGTGTSIGTPHYMSPEQARAQPIDGRSDIYSLGVVAYQALTGHVPYDGDDSFAIGYKHITEPIPTPQLITADERRLFEVIKRMLMKDPNDRFQSCEELLASIQNQPIAAPGSLRAMGVTAAVASVPVAPTTPVRVGSGSPLPPPLASMPTTPLDTPGVDRRIMPRERRGGSRRVADRSIAMKGQRSSAWLWVVLAVLGTLAGGWYYWSSRGFAPGAAIASSDSAPADSARALAASPDDTTAGQGAVVPPVADSVGNGSAAAVTPPVAPAESVPGSTPPVAAAAPAESGSIRITGLPRGSTVLIDERPAEDAVTRLPVGAHVIAISAPRHVFHAETVTVRAGEVHEVTPRLTPIGAPAERPRAQRPAAAPAETAATPTPTCEPGPGFNADRSCFDERPRPVEPPFVPVPPDAQTAQPQPSVLWVKVSADGKTLNLLRVRPSDDPAYEREVRAFARAMAWRPAVKNGQPVDAWTQMIFPPAR